MITAANVDPDELALAAEVVLDRLGLGSADKFLVVFNRGLVAIASQLEQSASKRAAEVRLCEFDEATRDGEEPPPAVAGAMRESSVVVMLTRHSLSHTRARMAATETGARIASMPGISPELFARAIPVDYDSLEQAGRALARRLTEADSCRITAPGGTEIELTLRGRTAVSDDGALHEPGAFGNLPAGEAYIAPLETDAYGTIVCDGSLAGWGMLDRTVAIEITDGRAISARGGHAAEWLLDTLDAGGDKGRVLAELGIGTNRSATISGQIVEDEKVAGTVHFAFGTNTSFGGLNQTTVHIDGLVRNATVDLDGQRVLHNGALSADL